MKLLLLLALSGPADTTEQYRGAAGHVRVEPPRVDTSIVVDGVLDEPVWLRAVRLTEFTQYSPVVDE